MDHRLHDLNVPNSMNPGFSFTSFDHLHNILYKSETAPRLHGTLVARRPGTGARAGDFLVAREGGDETWDQRVLLVPEAETEAARTNPDEDVSATWVRVNPCSRRGEGGVGGEGTRRIAHPFESTARLCCGLAENWSSSYFLGELIGEGRTSDIFVSRNENDIPGLSSESNTVHPPVTMCPPVRPLPS